MVKQCVGFDLEAIEAGGKGGGDFFGASGGRRAERDKLTMQRGGGGNLCKSLGSCQARPMSIVSRLSRPEDVVE